MLAQPGESWGISRRLDLLSVSLAPSNRPMPPSDSGTLRVGIDENGLGARLGPLLVTAVLAEVTDSGARTLTRLPKRVRKDLDDSKRVVSFGDHDLGEAWARAVCPDASTPSGLDRKSTRLNSSHWITSRMPSSA